MTASRASGRLLRCGLPPGLLAGLLGSLLAAGAAGAQDAGGEPAAPISLFPPTVTAPAPDAALPGGAPGGLPGTQPESGETSADGDIQINRLGELDPENLGVLDAARGGLGADAWAGSNRAAVEALMAGLPAEPGSPSLHRLLARLLLSSAKAPVPALAAGAQPTMADAVAAAQARDFLRLRAERLYAMGELAGLNQLLALVPQSVEDPWLARARVDGLLLAGRDAEACAQVPAGLARFPQDLYWAKAQIFCQFAAEETDRALLGLDLLREQAPDEDPAFFAAANLFIGGSGGADTGGLTPLTLAMLRKTGAALPPDLAETVEPPLLHGLAGLTGGDPALRAAAAERLVQLGALPGARLAGAYDAFEFTGAELGNALAEAERAAGTPGGGVRARALLYRAANRESIAATRAEILRAALLSAERDGRSGAMAQAALAVMDGLAPTPDLAWFAPLAARTLYRAGQFERAGAWLSVLRLHGQNHPESFAAYTRLQPLLRLAGGAQPLAAQADRPAQDRLLLFVLSRALGQPEDAAWIEEAEDTRPLAHLPRLLALGDAAAAGRRGETVLLTVAALGPEAPAGSHPLALGYAVSALTAVGLGSDARALAIEAALAAGL